MDLMDGPASAEFHDWKFESKMDHILHSNCSTPLVCVPTLAKILPNRIVPKDTPIKTDEEVSKLKSLLLPAENLCNFCKCNAILEMTHLPDMTYPQNGLKLTHSSGFVIDFNVIDALSPVIIKNIGLPHGMKVASSEQWLNARLNCEYTQTVHNAKFDWTFTTDYPGTLYGIDSKQITPTEEEINFQKLMVRDRIKWFREVTLFEDELADHGTAECSVKIRVMSDCFFILLRYFLRIDNVFVRFYDTRFYHEFGKNYLIRERCVKESTIPNLKLAEEDICLLVQPNELYPRVPKKERFLEKITFV